MASREPLVLTDVQVAFAKAIRLVEMYLEPSCADCGASVGRPNCFMVGPCSRHEQENAIAYGTVIRKLLIEAGLNNSPLWHWRSALPLDILYEFDDKEKKLLLELHDHGGRKSGRTWDERYTGLGCGSGRSKGAVLFSSSGGRDHIELTDRGMDLVKKWIKEEENHEQPSTKVRENRSTLRKSPKGIRKRKKAAGRS